MTGMDVTSSEEIMAAFADIKKSSTKLQYVQFTIDVVKDGAKHSGVYRLVTKKEKDGKEGQGAYEAMLATLTDSEPAFVVFDTHFTTRDGRPQQKLAMLVWCPDTLGVKHKMMVGSNAESVKGALDGVSKVLHASDRDEASWKNFVGMF
jgi:Cofilin/tropomyosin-type actin-binding protein